MCGWSGRVSGSGCSRPGGLGQKVPGVGRKMVQQSVRAEWGYGPGRTRAEVGPAQQDFIVGQFYGTWSLLSTNAASITFASKCYPKALSLYDGAHQQGLAGKERSLAPVIPILINSC